jgi:hypothetical protein
MGRELDPLPAKPYNLCLDPGELVAQTIESENHGQADLRGFQIIGGKGAGEYIAFDTRRGVPWPVVTIDMVAGGGSAAVIAADFDTRAATPRRPDDAGARASPAHRRVRYGRACFR